MKNLILTTLLVTAFFSTVAYCQPEDIANSKDHPLFNRMPHTTIVEYSHNFDQLEIRMNTQDTKTLEGTKTFINYTYDKESGAPPPSFLQIVRNYEAALQKSNGKRIFYSKEEGRATLFLRSDGKDVWITFEDRSGGNEGDFVLAILEVEPMKQDIAASAILDELNSKGFIALHINFETGKSVIKTESQGIVTEIAKMLNDNPTLNVSIEGHTDNVGKAEANKKLSIDRAASVLNALAVAGITKTRMHSTGWGQEKPVADNATDEGKAQNRRVEIVKVP